MDSNVITRFSPSPTGFLHVGSLRTALYNYLFARHHGGKFLLRIEDTDQSRLVEGAMDDILASLRWAGLKFDGEPVVQSKRLAEYASATEALVASGHAYRCFCTEERLAQLRTQQQAAKQPTRYDGHCRGLAAGSSQVGGEPSIIRFVMPSHTVIELNDLVHGTVRVNTDTLDDAVLLKSDGFPTYHLASVVDDHAAGVSHIIRGIEWLPSAHLHTLLYAAFGWTPPQFPPLPLLLNPDRTKMSKRQGDVAVNDYRVQGYLPEALLNFVLLLGWNPKTDEEVFTLPEMVQRFDLAGVNKSGAIFNHEKLDWMNGVYLRRLPLEEFVTRAWPFLESAGLVDEHSNRAGVARYAALEQNRIKRLADLPELIAYCLRAPTPDPTLLPYKQQTKPDAREKLLATQTALQSLAEGEWNTGHLEAYLKAFIADQQFTTGSVLWPLRVALSGRRESPPPFDIAAALGKAQTLQRLVAAATALE